LVLWKKEDENDAEAGVVDELEEEEDIRGTDDDDDRFSRRRKGIKGGRESV
jgi:hypothetical protein